MVSNIWKPIETTMVVYEKLTGTKIPIPNEVSAIMKIIFFLSILWKRFNLQKLKEYCNSIKTLQNASNFKQDLIGFLSCIQTDKKSLR